MIQQYEEIRNWIQYLQGNNTQIFNHRRTRGCQRHDLVCERDTALPPPLLTKPVEGLDPNTRCDKQSSIKTWTWVKPSSHILTQLVSTRASYSRFKKVSQSCGFRNLAWLTANFAAELRQSQMSQTLIFRVRHSFWTMPAGCCGSTLLHSFGTAHAHML